VESGLRAARLLLLFLSLLVLTALTLVTFVSLFSLELVTLAGFLPLTLVAVGPLLFRFRFQSSLPFHCSLTQLNR